jgi:N,N'-diacetyllegionaminate synthase
MKIISEIGINHNGDFRRIEELIRQSALGGADFAKFQLYSSQRVFGDDSRKKNEFSFEQVAKIKQICDYYGIEFFASVFDEEKIEWCEELGVERYKIASRTVVAEPELCKKVIALGKTTYISLGFWSERELPFVEDNIQYFNCISKYPTSCLDVKDFSYDKNIIGLSDHSYGISYALFNISKGASFIEKHFTLDKSMDGNDHIGSMNLSELKLLRKVGNELFNIKRAITNEK